MPKDNYLLQLLRDAFFYVTVIASENRTSISSLIQLSGGELKNKLFAILGKFNRKQIEALSEQDGLYQRSIDICIATEKILDGCNQETGHLRVACYTIYYRRLEIQILSQC